MLTSTDLANIGNHSEWVSFGTPYGQLTINGFTATTSVGGVATVANVSYRYDLSRAPNNAGTDTSDPFQIVVTDVKGVNSAAATFTVDIVDDAPTAHADTGDVTEDSGTALVGNVISPVTTGDVADRVGADGATVSAVTVDLAGSTTGTGTVGTGLDGQYGTLKLNSDGSYTYVLDDGNARVNALKDGETLTETYHYTIKDADGDTSTTTLTITIHGHTDGTATIAPHDGNGTNAAGGDAMVYESGLTTDGPSGESRSATDTIDITAPDGLVSIAVGGQVLTAADLAALSATNPKPITTADGSTLLLTGFDVTESVGGVPTKGTAVMTPSTG